MKPEEIARAFVTKHVGHYYCEPGDDPCPQHPDGLWQNKPCDCQFEDKVTALTAVIQAAVEAEREAIAKMVETGDYECRTIGYVGVHPKIWEADLAKAIRSRGKPCE